MLPSKHWNSTEGRIFALEETIFEFEEKEASW
jgi:hypothetical protein